MAESKKRKLERTENEISKRRKFEITPSPEPESRVITHAYHNEDTPVPRFFSTERPVMSSTLATGSLKLLETLEGHLFLPVSRYSDLFHLSDSETKRKFTGKFYFYEPDSPFVLDLGKTRVFGSKFHALSTLTPKERDELKQDLLQIMGWEYVQGILQKQTTGKMPSVQDIRLQRHIIGKEENKLLDQIFNQYYTSVIPNRYSIPKIPVIQTTPLFPTDSAKLWSKRNFGVGGHDFMDIPIYEAAKSNGLDTVILQHEVGEYRAVTEIVDTREDSQNHVFKLPPEMVTAVKQPINSSQDWTDIDQDEQKPDKYATIWFLDDGFLKLKNGQFEWSDQ